ncbi:MAG: hypothetical protein ACOYJB_01365 [Christensenellaceae bacterium]|jgi:hypothetical protein
MYKSKRRRLRNKRIRFALIVAGAVALVCLFVFLWLPGRLPQNETPAEAAVNFEEEPMTDYDTVDDETRAGLLGEQSALSANADEREKKIGITLLGASQQDSTLLTGMEKAAQADIAAGNIEDFYFYDAENDHNQQIQDVFTMVNNGVKIMIVMNTDEYNYIKIADIANRNGISLITYHTDAENGFTVDLRDSGGNAQDFADFMLQNGVQQTDVLNGTSEQLEQIQSVLPVGTWYEDFWDAAAAIRYSLDSEAPKDSMIVLDYNGGDILKNWLNNGAYPKAYAAVATVNYIKTWYALLNGGYTPPQEVDEDGNAVQPETPPVTVSATPDQFKGMAVTSAQNIGDILYAFAIHLANGDVLPEAEYVYEVSATEFITNENLASFYEQVKNEENGLVYSSVDAASIDGLFAAAQQQAAEEEQPMLLAAEQKGSIAVPAA